MDLGNTFTADLRVWLPPTAGSYSAMFNLRNMLPVVVELDESMTPNDTFDLYGDSNVLLGCLRGNDPNSKILVQSHLSVFVIRTGGSTQGSLIARPPVPIVYQPMPVKPLCNCTTGFPCVPPGGRHRDDCPIARGWQREAAEKYDALGVKAILRRIDAAPIPLNQAWNEIARPMVSIEMAATPAQLREENEKLRTEVLEARCERLARAALLNEIDKLRAANESLTRENARLRAAQPVDQRPGPRTPCAACDDRRVVPRTDANGKLVTVPCSACAPQPTPAPWWPGPDRMPLMQPMTANLSPVFLRQSRVSAPEGPKVPVDTSVRRVEMDDD